MDLLQRIGDLSVRGVATVLRNPVLLFGLMGLSLLLKKLAAPNREGGSG